MFCCGWIDKRGHWYALVYDDSEMNSSGNMTTIEASVLAIVIYVDGLSFCFLSL